MNKRISKPTWIIHAVCDGTRIIYQTQGLDKYDSLELEVTLQLNDKQAMHFINLIGLEIANGKKFKDGDFDDSIFTCKIAFREMKGIYGEGKKILRVIFPDPNFKFPWDEECDIHYMMQLPIGYINIKDNKTNNP